MTESQRRGSPPTQATAFWAVFRRDVHVTVRQPVIFVVQVVLQPLFLLFVFGKVLAQLGYTRPGYSDLLFAGVIALSTVLTAMQSLALPLAAEFGWSRESEDRLLAPVATSLIAVEKMVFAILRALVAALAMIAAGLLVFGAIPWRWSSLPLFVAAIVLGAAVGAGLGLILGTAVASDRIGIVSAIVITPLIFTGCSQYSWPSLESMRWFQVITALNPLTYVSETVRAALTPDVPHMSPAVALSVLVVYTLVLTAWGLRSFSRRAVT